RDGGPVREGPAPPPCPRKAGPGRFRPRVPLPVLRPGRAGRALGGNRGALAGDRPQGRKRLRQPDEGQGATRFPEEAERTGTEIAGRGEERSAKRKKSQRFGFSSERTPGAIAEGRDRATYLLPFGRHGPRAPLPELPLNGQTGNGAWQQGGVSDARQRLAGNVQVRNGRDLDSRDVSLHSTPENDGGISGSRLLSNVGDWHGPVHETRHSCACHRNPGLDV